jgi:hypothetical protein
MSPALWPIATALPSVLAMPPWQARIPGPKGMRRNGIPGHRRIVGPLTILGLEEASKTERLRIVLLGCLPGLSCIFRGIIRRVLSKPDPDDLICASALLVGDVMEDTVVRVAGVSAYDSPRPQVPGEHGVELRSVEADFGQ